MKVGRYIVIFALLLGIIRLWVIALIVIALVALVAGSFFARRIR